MQIDSLETLSGIWESDEWRALTTSVEPDTAILIIKAFLPKPVIPTLS